MDAIRFFKIRQAWRRWLKVRHHQRHLRQRWMFDNHKGCKFPKHWEQRLGLAGAGSGESLRSLCRRCAKEFGVSWRTCYDDWRAALDPDAHKFGRKRSRQIVALIRRLKDEPPKTLAGKHK